MKVMKFGGISLGTSEAIRNVIDIIKDEKHPVVIVVSALYGVTEQLLKAANYALNANKSYEIIVDSIESQHIRIINEIAETEELEAELHNFTASLLEDLKNILRGVFLIGDLSQKTSDKIVSYGERLSSLLLSKIIPHATLYDSTQFLKTTKQFNTHIPDLSLCNELIKKEFHNS